MPEKMRYCFYCGEELGVSAYYDPFDNCGRSECSKAARDALAEERERRHEEADEALGWYR
jgi:hypothetical protein